MSLQEQTRKMFLKKVIREYYGKKPLEEPPDLHKREIAIESLEDSAYIRHLTFPYMESLYDFILNVKTPLHLYYSSAIYTHPSALRMEDKLWEGSELLFDIDADKYPGCETKYWICPGTGSIHTSEPEKCERGEKPLEYSIVPWSCIVRAWEDVLKLVDILREELGLTNVKIYFSGNRGFHVKVYDQKALQYDRDVRRAIAEYVSCTGMIIEKMFPLYKGYVVFSGMEYGVRERVFRTAMKRGVLLPRKAVGGVKNVYVATIEDVQKILEDVCIKVDKSVTMDISRLSRFVRSLNMKSGLRTIEIEPSKGIENLSYVSFSPFKGLVKVKPLVSAELPVLDTKVSLKRGEVTKIESHIAIYLVVKGVTIPVDMADLEVKP